MKVLGAIAVLVLFAALPLGAQNSVDYAFANAPYGAARDLVDLLAQQYYSQASDRFDESVQGTYTSEALEKKWRALLKAYGPIRNTEVKAADVEGTMWRIHVLCTFDKGVVDAVVSFNSLSSSKDAVGITFTPTLGQQGPFKVQ